MRSNRPATTAVSALWPKSRERYKIPFFLSFLLPNKMVVEKTNTQTNNKVIPAGGWRSRRLFRVYKQSPRTRKKKKKQAASVVVGTKEFWRCWARPEPLSPSRKRRRIHHPSLSLLTCTHVYSRVFSSSSSTNMAAHRQGPKSEMMWISLNSILKDADVMAGPDWVVPITHKLRKRKKTNGGYRWAVSRLHSATTAAIRSHTKKKKFCEEKTCSLLSLSHSSIWFAPAGFFSKLRYFRVSWAPTTDGVPVNHKKRRK